MNDSDHISIAHSKIDKFESLLLINHVFKRKMTRNLLLCFFKVKTNAFLGNETLHGTKTEPSRLKHAQSWPKILRRLAQKWKSKKQSILDLFCEFVDQTRKINRAKLEKVGRA